MIYASIQTVYVQFNAHKIVDGWTSCVLTSEDTE